MRDALSKQTSSSSGSSESELTALVVSPAGPSAPVAVTIATPVAKLPDDVAVAVAAELPPSLHRAQARDSKDAGADQVAAVSRAIACVPAEATESRPAPASVTTSSRRSPRSCYCLDLQLPVLAEVVVVADRARQPVLAGLEDDRRALGAATRPGAACRCAPYSLGSSPSARSKACDGEVVGQPAGVAHDQVDAARRDHEVLGADAVLVEGDLEHAVPVVDVRRSAAAPQRGSAAPRRRRAGSLRMKGSRMMPGRMNRRRPLLALTARRRSPPRPPSAADRRRATSSSRAPRSRRSRPSTRPAPSCSSSAARAATTSTSSGPRAASQKVARPRAHRRPELQRAQGGPRRASSTRSATAASPARSCRRTSSSARRPTQVADFLAKYAGHAGAGNNESVGNTGG